jgi:hypothetical protein
MSAQTVEVVAGEENDCFRYAWGSSGETLERRWRVEVVMWKMTRTRMMASKTVDLVYFLKNLNLCHEAKIS